MNPSDDLLRAAHLHALEQALLPFGCHVRLNRNSRVLLSLRHRRPSGLTVSLHHQLLDHPLALAEIPAWIGKRGRHMTSPLRDALSLVFHAQRQVRTPPPAPDLPVLGGPCHLSALFEGVFSRHFAQLPRPAVGWSRASPNRKLRHIRFGCYRRQPSPRVELNPRLNQPWVATAFVEHVIFHELCHHAQACAPVRGETAHSRRFRTWERAFPQHREAQAWERANLTRLLAPMTSLPTPAN